MSTKDEMRAERDARSVVLRAKRIVSEMGDSQMGSADRAVLCGMLDRAAKRL